MIENFPYQQSLTERLRGKDLSAFEQFYEDFFPSLCVFAHKYIQDEDIAKDIGQDAFLYFWRKKININSISAAKSYLFKYVKNRSLNYLRDKRGGNEDVLNYKEKEVYFRDLIIEEETYQIIHNAVVSLPPKGQRVIELTLDGLKNHEIAEEMGVSINTVKTTKRRAFDALRTELKENIMALFSLVYRKNPN